MSSCDVCTHEESKMADHEEHDKNRWKTFLRDAGIKDQFVEDYAEYFHINRMQEDMIVDLTKDILKDIGIQAVGDIVLILKYSKKVSASTSTSINHDAINIKSTDATTIKQADAGPSSNIVVHRSRQLTITSDGRTGPELIVTSTANEMDKVEVQMARDELLQKSAIYRIGNTDTGTLTKYQLAINNAAYELCLADASLLNNKGQLLALSRKKVDDEGYCYKRKRSRSNAFGTGNEKGAESKQVKCSVEFRQKRIGDLSEDMDSINTTMALLEKERYKQHNMKKYAQAASIEEQISVKRKEKRALTEELTKLKVKEARSKRYHMGKGQSRKDVKGKGKPADIKGGFQQTLLPSLIKPQDTAAEGETTSGKKDCSTEKSISWEKETNDTENESSDMEKDGTDVDPEFRSEQGEIDDEKDTEKDCNHEIGKSDEVAVNDNFL